MKLSHLKHIIKESIKGLMNEQSGFQTTIKCPSGFTVKQLNSTGPQGPGQNIATYTLRNGLESYDRRKGWRGPLTNIKNFKNWTSGNKSQNELKRSIIYDFLENGRR